MKESTKNNNIRDIFLTTKDGVELSAGFLDEAGLNAAILLHMMPAEKSSYYNLMGKLKERGITSVAVDLRGHGKSEGGPEGYKKFSHKDHQNSIKDAEAISEFLEEKGFNKSRQFIVGASIGANLGLWFASDHNEIGKIALLSPGIDYKGIKAGPLVKKLKENQSIFISGSEDDIRPPKETETGDVLSNNADMCRYISSLIPEEVGKELVIYKEAGHGTAMFGKEQPDLEEKISDFLGSGISNH